MRNGFHYCGVGRPKPLAYQRPGLRVDSSSPLESFKYRLAQSAENPAFLSALISCDEPSVGSGDLGYRGEGADVFRSVVLHAFSAMLPKRDSCE